MRKYTDILHIYRHRRETRTFAEVKLW
jgi:hypothetical protein